jgi:hypothetical protein
MKPFEDVNRLVIVCTDLSLVVYGEGVVAGVRIRIDAKVQSSQIVCIVPKLSRQLVRYPMRVASS